MKHKRKLSELENRMNITDKIPLYYLLFQDCKTFPNNPDLEKAKIVLRVNLNQNDI